MVTLDLDSEFAAPVQPNTASPAPVVSEPTKNCRRCMVMPSLQRKERTSSPIYRIPRLCHRQVAGFPWFAYPPKKQAPSLAPNGPSIHRKAGHSGSIGKVVAPENHRRISTAISWKTMRIGQADLPNTLLAFSRHCSVYLFLRDCKRGVS